MIKNFSTVALASAAALSLLLAGCGGNSGDSSDAAGSIVIRGCTPKAELIPGNTSETCGGDMIAAMTSALVRYDTETGEPVNDIAESIETSDSQHFTVTLKKGYKFHDGTEVKAHNFVDAWNFTAAFENGQAGAYFFTPILGYEDVAEEGATKTELEGLKVVDDYTFTIETTEPTSNLPVRLGYSTFNPLPDSFFEDQAAFEENPIGAGPFKFVSKSTTEYVFEKFDDYSGEWPAHVDQLTFRIYTDDAAAYSDVISGNLDYTNSIPSDILVTGQIETDLPDQWLKRETGRFNALVFSPVDEQLANNADLRAAISMAIDRQLISEQIFGGVQKPAHGWAPSLIDGATDTACGEKCDYNPTKAKELYEQSGGYEGTLTITVNGDASHKTWSDAVCNSITNTLGLDCVTATTPDFASFQIAIDDDAIQGLFRSGWQMDYPSIENFLAPIYGTGADSNWSDYSNPEFDAKLAEAAAASDVETANALYHEAEEMLGRDLPTAPLWYPESTVAWSQNVENVAINVQGVLDYSAITVK